MARLLNTDDEIKSMELELDQLINRRDDMDRDIQELRDEIKAKEGERRTEVLNNSIAGIQLYLSTCSVRELANAGPGLSLLVDQICDTLAANKRQVERIIIKQADPEFEKLLAEEEAIDREAANRAATSIPRYDSTLGDAD